MTMPLFDLPDEAISRAVAKAGGRVRSARGESLSGEELAAVLQALIEDSEKAPLVFAAIEEQLKELAKYPVENKQVFSNPVSLKYSAPSALDDYFVDDLPSGAPRLSPANQVTPVSETCRYPRVKLSSEHCFLVRDGFVWATPKVLGFLGDTVEEPYSSLINSLISKAQNKLSTRVSKKTGLVRKYLYDFWEKSDSWEVVSDRLAANYTVVVTTHGHEKMIINSLVSGIFLYLTVEEPNANKPLIKECLRLSDQEGSLQKLSEMFYGHEEVAQKTLSNLHFFFDQSSA